MVRILVIVALIGVGILSAEEKPLMRDFVGLNGHFTFKPELYRPVTGLVRNYHNINWDVAKPGDTITIPVCVNKVDWDKHVYDKWSEHGYEIDLCVQFGSFGPGNKDYQKLWEGQENWAYDYGYALAEHFGLKGKQGTVSSIEIGNEPGVEFDDALYQTIFKQMAQGIRDAEAGVKIVTATAAAREADKYHKSLDETFASPEIIDLYDVINVHTYATLPKQDGRSPWDRSYPEDPEIEYLKVVDDVVAWRDTHAPGKEIWITEFGYDACTDEAMTKRDGWFKKLNWQGVTELQQAQYLVRSLLAFTKRPVDRAYIYYYNDDDKASVHAASGLTRNFIPKPAYWAVKQFYETLGDYRFNRVVQEDKTAYIYEFLQKDGEDYVWAVWSPTGSELSNDILLTEFPGKLATITSFQTQDGLPRLRVPKIRLGDNGREYPFTVLESPQYLLFESN